jgi:hypothetical protein
MPNKYLHRPFDAPESVLSAAGIRLGKTYPLPIVNHDAARQRAQQSSRDNALSGAGDRQSRQQVDRGAASQAAAQRPQATSCQLAKS